MIARLFVVLFLFGAVLPVSGQPDAAQFNSVAEEFQPIFSPDGRTLYFVRGSVSSNIGGVKDKGDIYYSAFLDTAWTSPANIGRPINSVDANGIAGFSPDGKTMYLYGHYNNDGSKARTQGLSQSYYANGKWGVPKKLPIEYFLNKSQELSATISKDGRVMVLSMDSFGSYGGEDLYVSFLQPDGTWSQPKNMGSVLNTKLQEMTPHISNDNTRLYFASNGHEGYGSRDIFVSNRLDDTWRTWSAPKNLGAEINSEGLELSFQFVEDDLAMFITTQNSDGYGDIRFRRFNDEELKELLPETIAIENPKKPTIDLREVTELADATNLINVFGTVKNASTSSALGAIIKVTGEKGFARELAADENGGYSIPLPTDDSYRFELEAPGFLTVHEGLELRTQEIAILELNFNMYPITVGTTIKLDHVIFHQGTANLIDSSSDQLDIVTQMMKDNPAINIDLSGHTDNRGSFRLNLQLSQQRVEKVKEYLVAHGITEARISGKGYGGTRPVASNASEETRKLNRRVEFTIVRN